MFYVRHGDTYILRFEEDEIFPDRFLEFLAAEEIGAGSFTAIGAMSRTTVAYFDTGAREYLDKEFDEQMEVLALAGNVSMHDGAPLAHAHITLGRRDYSVVGGHLRHGVVRPTLELVLRVLPEPVQRKIDPAYGLPGLDLTNRF